MPFSPHVSVSGHAFPRPSARSFHLRGRPRVRNLSWTVCLTCMVRIQLGSSLKMQAVAFYMVLAPFKVYMHFYQSLCVEPSAFRLYCRCVCRCVYINGWWI